MAEESNSAFVWAHRVLKTVAIFGGGAVTLVSLMSLVGLLSDNGWVRAGVALVVGLVVPLVASDRLLPDGDDVRSGRGLPTDIFAVFYLGLALAFVAVPPTQGLLRDEGDRLARSGWALSAEATWFLAGVDPTAETVVGEDEAADGEPAVAAAGADASVAVDGGADVVDAAAGVDGGVTPDAGPPPELGEERTPAEIFNRWAPSVVSIQIGGGGGTGFLISDGVVVTNSHVIHGANQVKVKLKDGTWADEVWLLSEDETNDLALLRIVGGSQPEAVVMGDSDTVQVGERAVSIGNPLGLEHTLTDGLVSARRIYGGRRMIQMSTPVSPGNSGGPLFNGRGEVIAVTTAQVGGGLGRAQNLNLATPINTLQSMIRPGYSDERRIGGGGGDSGGSW